MESPERDYDYSFKFLLVGDPDVGKEEILAALEDASPQSPYATRGMEQKTTLLMIDGRRVKLQLWSTSGKCDYLLINCLLNQLIITFKYK